MSDLAISYEDVAAAHTRVAGAARRTPVLTSSTADAMTGARLFFKCENLQRMGAFKFRGAFNALSKFDEQRRGGVVAFSSGNHARPVALAARILGMPATIVMPQDAPAVEGGGDQGLRRRGGDLRPLQGGPRADRARARAASTA